MILCSITEKQSTEGKQPNREGICLHAVHGEDGVQLFTNYLEIGCLRKLCTSFDNEDQRRACNDAEHLFSVEQSQARASDEFHICSIMIFTTSTQSVCSEWYSSRMLRQLTTIIYLFIYIHMYLFYYVLTYLLIVASAIFVASDVRIADANIRRAAMFQYRSDLASSLHRYELMLTTGCSKWSCVWPRCDRTLAPGITYSYRTYVIGKNNVRVR